MSCDVRVAAEVPVDPAAVVTARDDDALLIDNLHRSARRKPADIERVSDVFEQHADRQHGAQAAIVVVHWAGERDDPLVARARTDHFADRSPLSSQDLAEKGAVADK